jgi:hypothetical protein
MRSPLSSLDITELVIYTIAVGLMGATLSFFLTLSLVAHNRSLEPLPTCQPMEIVTDA